VENNWEAVHSKLSRKELKLTVEKFVNSNTLIESEAGSVVNTKEFIEIRNLCEVCGLQFNMYCKRTINARASCAEALSSNLGRAKYSSVANVSLPLQYLRK